MRDLREWSLTERFLSKVKCRDTPSFKYGANTIIIGGVEGLSVTSIGNRSNVRPGDPAFNIMSNLCDYFEVGQSTGNDIWLEGKIEGAEFVFNGRLFMHDGTFGTLIDSFPKGPTPQGWTQRRKLDVDGYELRDSNDEVIFSYHVVDKICFVDVNLYKADGAFAAHAGQGGLVCHVPAKLGRNGIVMR